MRKFPGFQFKNRPRNKHYCISPERTSMCIIWKLNPFFLEACNSLYLRFFIDLSSVLLQAISFPPAREIQTQLVKVRRHFPGDRVKCICVPSSFRKQTTRKTHRDWKMNSICFTPIFFSKLGWCIPQTLQASPYQISALHKGVALCSYRHYDRYVQHSLLHCFRLAVVLLGTPCELLIAFSSVPYDFTSYQANLSRLGLHHTLFQEPSTKSHAHYLCYFVSENI